MRGATGGSDGPPVQGWYLAVTAAVLLIACANVANLLLARGVYREHGFAVRASLGATRSRIAGLLLTESALLAVLGSLFGVAFAALLWRLLPAVIELPALPPFVGFRNAGVLVAVALGTVVIFGAAPLVGLSRPDLVRLLGSSSPRISTRSRGRSLLVVVQFAVSVVLLVGAGLFIRSYQAVQGLDLGYDRENLLLMSAAPQRGADAAEPPDFWENARERLASDPAVRDVALGSGVPYRMRMMIPLVGDLSRDAGPDAIDAPQADFVGENYFETMRIPILEGRSFGGADREGSAPVAIVSRSYALEQFSGASPLGKCLTMPTGAGGCIEVIGVAADARLGDVTDQASRFVYRPLGQRPSIGLSSHVLYLRISGDLSATTERLRRELTAMGGGSLQIEALQISDLIGPQLTPWRGSAALMTAFAAVGILLATIGLFGVISFLVARRTREIGIRLALGARRQQILRMVLGDAGRLVGAGAVIGLLAAFVTARTFSSLFFGVATMDPLVILGTLATLALVGVAAAYSPAFRASTIDPMSALREE